MAKISMREGEIPCFPDNEEFSVRYDSKYPHQTVVLKMISHYYWQDGTDHPSTLSIYYDIETAESLLEELWTAIRQARSAKQLTNS